MTAMANNLLILADISKIKFVSDLQQVGGFLHAFRFPPPLKMTATI
jgi:hypothetical protein